VPTARFLARRGICGFAFLSGPLNEVGSILDHHDAILHAER
jgi:hypothetical protein